jgi:hypothetical protein
MAITNAKVTQVTVPQLAGTTATVTAVATQQDGVTGFKPEVLTLTIVEKVTQTVISGPTSVLSSCDASGNVSLELTPANRALLNPTGNTIEIHQLIFEWTWNSGARKGAAIIEYVLQRNANV